MPKRFTARPVSQTGEKLSHAHGWILRVGPYASVLLGLSAIVLIWVGAYHFSESEFRQTKEAAIQNASNLSRTFEENIIRTIQSVDETLFYIRDGYARDPAHFSLATWEQNREFLTGIHVQIAVIDKNGLMVMSNVPGSQPGLDLSDREHFRVHANRTSDELFISKPVLGRASNKWSIQLTRRITMVDGTFGGVVVVSIDPAYLSSFYKSIDVGDGGSITLVGTDGIIRARGSKGASAVGESLAGSQLFDLLKASNVGSYSTTSQLDGTQRLVVFRKIKDFPLVVAVGLASDEVFRAYVSNRFTNFLIASVLTAWLLGVTALIAVYQRSLGKALHAAEAGTRARSEFLAMMSHEIRTPMNGVVGMAEILLESDLNDEQRPYAKTLRQSAEHLLQILNDVLDFSKLDAGRLDIEHIEFDPREIIQSSVDLLEASARDKGLTVSIDVDSSVPQTLIGDPARLRQLLLNLLGNALKFTKVGGVNIKAFPISGDARTRYQIGFEVQDTGIGIPADGLPLLFREFSQLDSTIARRFGGTGLGLAICKRLVDLLEGEISVTSKINHGTTFRFVLPFLVDNKRHASNQDPTDLIGSGGPSSVPTERSGPLKILLVEDDATNQLVATKMLQALGYSIEVASNGADAVAKCSYETYDLVFMDVMMPEMDGLSATRTIRALPTPYNRTYIVALTANAQAGDREMCLQAGMNDFLTKPVTMNTLRQRLEQFKKSSITEMQSAGAAEPARRFTGLSVFDVNIQNEMAEVLSADDVCMIVDAFLKSTKERLAVMATASRHGDQNCIKHEAHSAKSSAASLGFLRFSHLAKMLEQDALTLGPSILEQRVAELDDAFIELNAALASHSTFQSKAA